MRWIAQDISAQGINDYSVSRLFSEQIGSEVNYLTQGVKMETQTELVVVTPDKAREWLTSNRYEHQRNLRQDWVKYLAEEMLHGSFKQDTPIEFSIVDGHDYLTDGQHRMAAITVANAPQRFVVIRRSLESDMEAALDYTRTDKGRRRTFADDYKTLMLEEELGLTATQVNALGTAVIVINNQFSTSWGKNIVHPDDRLRLMREYNDAYGHYLEAIAGSRRDYRHRLERSATLSVALVTLRYSISVYGEEKVMDFWHGVALDDGLRANDPRKVAIRHIVEVGMFGGPGGAMRTASRGYSARWVANCFNAWVDDKTLTFTTVKDATKPILIKGSPFNGKE